MKIGTDTYIQGKQEHCDQDVIKSCSSYICLTPARKNIQTNSIPPFLQNPPLLRMPPTIQQFFHPPFLEVFGKFNPPLWFCLTSLTTIVLLMWKWMSLFLRQNHLLRGELTLSWGWPFLLTWIGLLHYLYCLNCLQENWSFNLFYEVSCSWGCSISL